MAKSMILVQTHRTGSKAIYTNLKAFCRDYPAIPYRTVQHNLINHGAYNNNKIIVERVPVINPE